MLEDGHELLSADVARALPAERHVDRAGSLAALVREDILARDGSRYAVVDSLFREWVARKTFY